AVSGPRRYLVGPPSSPGEIFIATAGADGRLNVWRRASSRLPGGRTASTAIVAGNYLLVIGGAPPGEPNVLSAFIDPATGDLAPFEAQPDLGAQRDRPSVALDGERIYVWGGTKAPLEMARFENGVIVSP